MRLHTQAQVKEMIAQVRTNLAQVQKSLDSVNDVKEAVFEPAVMILILSNKKNMLLKKLELADRMNIA